MKIHPILSTLLLPASWLYGSAAKARVAAYRSGRRRAKRLEGVVISVGNLTVGGTGKTPMVLWLAERLAKLDVPVGILTRGYKGELGLDRRTKEAIKSQFPGAKVPWSDEVALLSRRLGARAKFGVGAERWDQGMLLSRLGIKWFILDDGFQHLQLYRHVDIVLVDSTNPFGGGRLLPAGPLREPPEALERADMVVITRADSSPPLEAQIRAYSQAPIFFARTELEEIRPLEDVAPQCGKADWLGKRVFAFCGIGNPGAFFRDVEHWGMRLAGTLAFGDHHLYRQADAACIERDAIAADAEALVCTEKDSHNLRHISFEKLPVFSCDVTMRVADGDRFWQTILDVIEAKRGASQ